MMEIFCGHRLQTRLSPSVEGASKRLTLGTQEATSAEYRHVQTLVIIVTRLLHSR
jgi:hypothetical protein